MLGTFELVDKMMGKALNTKSTASIDLIKPCPYVMSKTDQEINSLHSHCSMYLSHKDSKKFKQSSKLVLYSTNFKRLAEAEMT